MVPLIEPTAAGAAGLLMFTTFMPSELPVTTASVPAAATPVLSDTPYRLARVLGLAGADTSTIQSPGVLLQLARKAVAPLTSTRTAPKLLVALSSVGAGGFEISRILNWRPS